MIDKIKKIDSNNKNHSKITKFLKIINKNIFDVKKILKKKLLQHSESALKIESNLALLKFYKFKLKTLKDKIKNCDKQCLIWQDLESCFNSRIRTGVIINLNIKDPREFLNKSFRSFSCKIKKALLLSTVKVNVIFSGNFIKPQTNSIDLKTFTTKNEVIDLGTDLKKWYKEFVIDRILKKLEEFQERDSGWALYEILSLKVNINKYVPLKGGAITSSYMDVPKFIKLKKAVVNVKNNDNFCFLWSIVSALHPAKKNSNRIESYPHFSTILKFDNINFPISFKDIGRFEVMNRLRINVYGIESKKIVPFFSVKI